MMDGDGNHDEEAAAGVPVTGEKPCPECDAKGEIEGRPCPECLGMGKVTEA